MKKQNWNELTVAVESPSLEILRPSLDMAFTNLLWVVHILQCCISLVPPRTARIHIITLGKIRVVGQLRKIKCQTVLETDTLILSLYVPPSHSPPGIPTTHWMKPEWISPGPGIAASLWALCSAIHLQDVSRTVLEERIRFLTLAGIHPAQTGIFTVWIPTAEVVPPKSPPS